MRYLSIDYGQKRTGLAVCDESETFVSPLVVLQNSKSFVAEIVKVINSENIKAVVVGLPLNMDDSEGGQAKLTRVFADGLRKHIDIEIYFQDERLSSFAAEEKLIAMELTRKGKKKRLDAIAAANILESFLEKNKA